MPAIAPYSRRCTLSLDSRASARSGAGFLMLADQQDIGGVAGGKREGAQVLGLQVVQLRLAGAARHHRGLAAARLDDAGHGAIPHPPIVPSQSFPRLPLCGGLPDPSSRPVGGPSVTQAVWKLFFGDRDEVLNHEVDLRRNNDSSAVPSGFNCCAEGLGIRVFTHPGPAADLVSRRITGDQDKTEFNLPLFLTDQRRQCSRQRSPSPRPAARHPAVRLGAGPRIRSSRSP